MWKCFAYSYVHVLCVCLVLMYVCVLCYVSGAHVCVSTMCVTGVHVCVCTRRVLLVSEEAFGCPELTFLICHVLGPLKSRCF